MLSVFKKILEREIAPYVSEAVAVSWNNAIAKCCGLANSAGHFMLEAEMWKLTTTPEAVHKAVLKDLAAKEG